MIQRIRQFLYAVFGRLDAEANTFVRCYLSKEEQTLFYAMHEADQFHAWRVARSAQKKYLQYDVVHSDAYILLTRCALLHDIGARKGGWLMYGGRYCPSLYIVSYHISLNTSSGKRTDIAEELVQCCISANTIPSLGQINCGK